MGVFGRTKNTPKASLGNTSVESKIVMNLPLSLEPQTKKKGLL